MSVTNLLFRCTIYWLREIMSGKRKFLKHHEMRSCYCPQYQSLSIAHVLEFAFSYPNVRDYFPEDRDMPRLPREWILNMCHSLLKDDFQNFIDNKVEDRNEALKSTKGLTMNMAPEIYEIYKNSSSVSSKLQQRSSFMFILLTRFC